MLKSVEEIRTLREEVRAEVGGPDVSEDQISKWVTTHTGIDSDALMEYVEAGDIPDNVQSAFFAGIQLGAAARERVKPE